MTLQKKSKHNTSLVAENKNLSIQFSLDGFSFCVSNSDTKEVINFTAYTFTESVATPELLLNKIEAIFSSEAQLQQDFKNIEVIHQNNLATLVPNKFFDEEKLKTYLDFNIKRLATDFVTYDDFSSIEAKNVYVPYVNINNYLFQNFGEFEYKHHATVLIDKLIKNNSSSSKKMFVNVSDNMLDIVVLEDKKLEFYNSFNFNTKEDFIYYILFTAEQLNLNPDEFQLTLIGDVEKDSEIYKITYNYIRNVDFIKSTSGFLNFSEDFSSHSNYILAG